MTASEAEVMLRKAYKDSLDVVVLRMACRLDAKSEGTPPTYFFTVYALVKSKDGPRMKLLETEAQVNQRVWIDTTHRPYGKVVIQPVNVREACEVVDALAACRTGGR